MSEENPPNLEFILTRGVAEIIVEEEFREKLASGRSLRLKLGFDPSKPDLHIGHAIVLRKLRQFQELGHQVVLVVGDWTARIGDPSGRDESRPMLTPEEVQANAQTYMDQFFVIVDKERTEVRWQSEWYEGFTLKDVFGIVRHFTLAQMMAHETFRNRYEGGYPLTLTELLYPVLQAYDSVAIRADVEFGGTDQKFNNLAGRELQGALRQPPQDVFLVPLLPGTDGRKMGKTFDNTIDFVAPPDEMYGKVMSITDEMLIPYFTLTTDLPDEEIEEMARAMEGGTVNPRDLKMRLAREIVSQFHGPKKAEEAEREFIRIFRERELPSEMPFAILTADPTGRTADDQMIVYLKFESDSGMVQMPAGYLASSTANTIKCSAIDILHHLGLTQSKSEARRLISQGGVRLDGEKVTTEMIDIRRDRDSVLQVGKRRFVRLVPTR